MKKITLFGVMFSLVMALPAFATSGGVDTPSGITELPLAVNGATGLDVVAPSTTPSQFPSDTSTSPYVVIPGIVGIGTATPNAQLEVYGSAKVGYDTVCSTSSHAGKIRYNVTSKAFEGCNGSSWVPFGITDGQGTTQFFGEGDPNTGSDYNGYNGCAGAGYGFTVTRALDTNGMFVYRISALWRADYGAWTLSNAYNVTTSATVGGHNGRDTVYLKLVVDPSDNRSHASVIVSSCRGALTVPASDSLWGRVTSSYSSYAYWMYSFGPTDYLTTNPPL